MILEVFATMSLIVLGVISVTAINDAFDNDADLSLFLVFLTVIVGIAIWN